MQSLYEELRTSTMQHINTRLDRQAEERRQNQSDMIAASHRLEGVIMNQCFEKMRAASKEGHFYATLYTFNNSDLFEDTRYRTIFLLKGPLRKTQANTNTNTDTNTTVDPLLPALNRSFAPMEMFTKFDRKEKTHHVIVSWKK